MFGYSIENYIGEQLLIGGTTYCLKSTGTTQPLSTFLSDAQTALGGTIEFVMGELTKTPYGFQTGFTPSAYYAGPTWSAAAYHTINDGTFNVHTKPNGTRVVAPGLLFSPDDIIFIQLGNNQLLLSWWNTLINNSEFPYGVFPLILKSSGSVSYNYKVYTPFTGYSGSETFGIQFRDSLGTILDSRARVVGVDDYFSIDYYDAACTSVSRDLVPWFNSHIDYHLRKPVPNAYVAAHPYLPFTFAGLSPGTYVIYKGLYQLDDNTIRMTAVGGDNPSITRADSLIFENRTAVLVTK